MWAHSLSKKQDTETQKKIMSRMDLILSEVSGQREYYCLFKHQYVREEFPVYICCFAHGKAVFGVSKQSIKEIDK